MGDGAEIGRSRPDSAQTCPSLWFIRPPSASSAPDRQTMGRFRPIWGRHRQISTRAGPQSANLDPNMTKFGKHITGTDRPKLAWGQLRPEFDKALLRFGHIESRDLEAATDVNAATAKCRPSPLEWETSDLDTHRRVVGYMSSGPLGWKGAGSIPIDGGAGCGRDDPMRASGRQKRGRQDGPRLDAPFSAALLLTTVDPMR